LIIQDKSDLGFQRLLVFEKLWLSLSESFSFHKKNIMAVTRQIKEKALEKANDIFANAQSAVFVHFSGLEGEEVRNMRAKMKDEGVGYSVIKKTLIKKAAADSKIDGELPVLDGEIALAYSEGDATAPARLVKEFAKVTGDKVEIVGGFFEGKFQDKAQMTEIANIPSLDVLRGMFVNVINSPIQRAAIALGQIAEKKA
jgi:large subunit ribosomal protein L10